MKEKFSVSGMSCAACSARVEKAVGAVGGVESCSVNLLTNSMVVDGNATDEEIIGAVIAAGYGAAVDGGEGTKANTGAEARGDKGKENETRSILIRLCVSAVFLVVIISNISHNVIVMSFQGAAANIKVAHVKLLV